MHIRKLIARIRYVVAVPVLAVLALAGGIGAAVAVTAATTTSVTGNNLQCKAGTVTSACPASTSVADGQALTISASAPPPPPPPSSAVLLGDQTVEATSDGSSAPASEAFGYVAGQSGTAASASVYLTSTDGATVGLYADNASKPGALLDKGSIATNTSGWATIPLNGAVAISSGTRYWLAVGANAGGNIAYRDHDSTGNTFDWSGSGFPNPYGPVAQWNSNPISAYVSGPASTTPPPTTTTPPPTTTTTTTTPPPTTTGLHVNGNLLQDATGSTVRLHGVNRSGTEYACIQGWGIFDGPSDQASITAIKSWHANAVRVPLNEDCWLNINGVNSAYAGANYQNAIIAYVHLLEQNSIYPILELHWTAPGTSQATGQQPMPDRDHSPALWQGVAGTFKNDPNVIFDLFNEPYPDSNSNTTAAWTCWRDGGTCPGASYTAAGMQELVSAVRGTGAQNVIMLGGVQYANALDNWLTYEPTDPAGQLAASFHTYQTNICNSTACWNGAAGPLATHVPVITGEIGESDNSGSFIASYMNWADPKGISYLAWTWDTWGCGGAVLISDYNGTPCSPFGSTYRDHLLSTFP